MNVKLTWGSDPKPLERDIHNLQKQITKLEDKLQKVTNTSRRSNKAAKSGADVAIASIGSMAAGYITVQKATAAARMEFEAYIDTQRKAKQAALSIADIQRQALINLQVTSPAEALGFREQVGGISSRLGVKQETVWPVLSAAASARADLPRSAAIKATEKAIGMFPGQPDAAEEIATFMLNFQRSTGAKGDQAMGWLAAAGAKAQVRDIGKIARNLAPAVGSIMATGATPEASAALWATVTHATVDPMGKRSKTRAIDPAEKLAEFLPKEEGLTARIEKIRADPRLRRRFMAKYTFASGLKAPVEELLTEGTRVAKMFDSFREGMPTLEEAGKEFRQMMDAISAVPEQQTAGLSRAIKATTENLLLADPASARAGVIREDIKGMLQAAGEGGLASKIGLWAWEITGPNLANLQRMAEGQRQRFLHPKVGIRVGGFVAPAEIPERMPTALELKKAEIFEMLGKRLAELLEDILTEQRQAKRLTELLKDILTEQKQANRNPQPAALQVAPQQHAAAAAL